MIERTHCPLQVNALVNDPTIRPWVCGEGPLDMSLLLSDRRSVCLMHERGGMFFRWCGPGVFDCHIFLFAKGREALTLARAMIGTMAASYGARHLWALSPHRHVTWFARQLGFSGLGKFWTPDGEQDLVEMRF